MFYKGDFLVSVLILGIPLTVFLIKWYNYSKEGFVKNLAEDFVYRSLSKSLQVI